MESLNKKNFLMQTLVILFLISISTFAEEELFDYYAGKKEVTHNTRQHYPVINTPEPTLSKVNLITGDYIEDETDLVVAGAEPLSLRRFYNQLAPHDDRYGGWRYNPESYLVANFELENQPKFAAVGERSGEVICYDQQNDNHYTADLSKVLNSRVDPVNGKPHISNTDIFYERIYDTKDRNRFLWSGIISDGKGTTRSFRSSLHPWHSYVKIASRSRTQYGPNEWTPYLLPINEERLPNGNIICYTHEGYKSTRLHPQYTLLQAIQAYDSTKTQLLGALDFEYQIDGNQEITGFTVTGSDGRTARFTQTPGDLTLLSSVEATAKGRMDYQYDPSFKSCISSDGTHEMVEYDPITKKVKTICQLIDGKLQPYLRFEYDEEGGKKETRVLNNFGMITTYAFDSHNRINAISQTHEGKKKARRVETYRWDDKKGDLLSKTIEDSQGAISFRAQYTYDTNHNVLTETIGNDEESYTMERTYSQDGFNLVLSESDGCKTTQYHYLPGTNLLAAEFVLDVAQEIQKRTFCTYDECAVCIKKIVDDGKSDNPHDLDQVTFRTITYTSPIKSHPCYGLPETVEEKYLNSDGSEALLHKVKYSYHPSGKIQREDHYDARNQYAYSVHSQYDNQERLITQVDKLGNKTERSYDAKSNLIKLTGPRSDMVKTWIYDENNHPIIEMERLDDKTLLTTRKKTNAQGQLIVDSDECGFETIYTYDPYGRIDTITHPDGVQKTFEYDILGNVAKEIDAKGYVTQKTYNFRNQLTTVVYPNGAQKTYHYNEDGTLSSFISKDGSRTDYERDIFGNPVKTHVYANNGTLLKSFSSTYSPFCELSRTDITGLTTTFIYDFAGRKTAETVGERTIFTEYDSLGRVAKISKEGSAQVYTYDFLDRLIEETSEDSEGNLLTQVCYQYDPAGNCTQVSSGNSLLQKEHNTRGEVTRIQRSDTNITTLFYTYEPKFKIQTTIDPLGIKTEQKYDCSGRETEKITYNTNNEIIQKELRSYDNCGNLIKLTHPIFENTTPLDPISYEWTYGPCNKVYSATLPNHSRFQYTYNHKGRIRTITKPDGTNLHHSYDDLGRLTRFYSNSKDIDYSYTYDHNDRTIAVQDNNNNTTTTRTYDIYGNLIKEVLGNNFAFESNYDPYGRRLGLMLPDKSTVTYSYRGDFLYEISRNNYLYVYQSRDLSGNPTEILLPGFLGSIQIARNSLMNWEDYRAPFFEESYTQESYDEAGKLLNYTYSDTLETEEISYEYNDLGLITSENDHTYTYDSLSNRRSKDTTTFTFNPLGQMTHDGRRTYTYDQNGNLLSDGERTYRYDSIDRLITISKGNIDLCFNYDHFDRTLFKQVFENKVLTDFNFYFWDQDQEIGSTVRARHIVELRIPGEKIDSHITSLTHEFNNKVYVPIHDHNGNVVSLIDLTTGKPSGIYRYTAFGEELLADNLTPWRFANRRLYSEIGLASYGCQCYNPSTGQYLSPAVGREPNPYNP